MFLLLHLQYFYSNLCHSISVILPLYTGEHVTPLSSSDSLFSELIVCIKVSERRRSAPHDSFPTSQQKSFSKIPHYFAFSVSEPPPVVMDK